MAHSGLSADTSTSGGRLSELGLLLGQHPLTSDLIPGPSPGAVVGMSRAQGCSLNGQAYRYLFRSSMAARKSCSLEATWQAIRSGFAYGAP